jgi:ABC-type antimicrobial peptide transport system permease subunit
MVVSDTLILAGTGLLLGLGLAIAFGRALSSFLYEMSSNDPVTFAAVSALVLIVSLLAGLLPARSAIKFDPKVALRYE